MDNTVTTAEIKRRGMAALEERLGHGPLHILKRNRPAAVVLSEEEYQRLLQHRVAVPAGLSAVQWLLAQSSTGRLGKSDIDAGVQSERDSWNQA